MLQLPIRDPRPLDHRFSVCSYVCLSQKIKIKIELPQDPDIITSKFWVKQTTLSQYITAIYAHSVHCSLFTNAKSWNQVNIQNGGTGGGNVVYVHHGMILAVRKNEVMSFAGKGI